MKQFALWSSIIGGLVAIILFGNMFWESKDNANLKEQQCKDRSAAVTSDIRDLKTEFKYVRNDIDEMKIMLKGMAK